MPKESRDQIIFKRISVDTKGRGGEKRLLIVQATIDSLNTHGIQGTTYDSIAKIAKMQRSHVAYYFKTYEDLIDIALRFVIACAQDLTVELVQGVETPKDRITAIIKGAFLQAERYPKHAYVLSLLWNLSTIDPKYKFFNTEIRKMGADRIALLLELYYQGKKNKKENLPFLAKAVQSIAYGYLLESFSTNTFTSLSEASDQTLKVVFSLLDQ